MAEEAMHGTLFPRSPCVIQTSEEGTADFLVLPLTPNVTEHLMQVLTMAPL